VTVFVAPRFFSRGRMGDWSPRLNHGFSCNERLILGRPPPLESTSPSFCRFFFPASSPLREASIGGRSRVHHHERPLRSRFFPTPLAPLALPSHPPLSRVFFELFAFSLCQRWLSRSSHAFSFVSRFGPSLPQLFFPISLLFFPAFVSLLFFVERATTDGQGARWRL